ncbi:16S rRNA (uracil(1498)-N(3))-methyltransferase [Nautilia lithotrophica]
MQFIYFPDPSTQITITGDEHKYLFKVRRIKKNEFVKIRNLKDDYLYIYKIESINKKEAILSLIEKKLSPNKPKKHFHLAWCIIEPKNIEKTLPSLNEIGISKITFIYCEYSQKNFKIKLDRIEKILINSAQQCGRSNIPEIEIVSSSQEFFEKYKEFYALDFDGSEIECNFYSNKPFLIGPEGGFSDKERKYFKNKFKLKGFILRSETAAISICSKILL